MSLSSRQAFEQSTLNGKGSSISSSSSPSPAVPQEPSVMMTDADQAIIPDLMNIVFEYTNSTPLYGPTLFGNLSKLYAAQANLAAFHLVNGDKVTADELVDANPAILSCIVETTDRDGNSTKVRLFELAAMYGSFNIHETQLPCQKDFGLVERWMRHLPPVEAAERLKALNLSWSAERMEASKKAVTEFLTDMAKAKATTYDELKVELAMSHAKFQRFFKPDPNVVLTTGYIFDLQVLDATLDLFAQHLNGLGGLYSDKSNLFAILGFGYLQDRASMFDKQVFISSTYDAIQNKKMPNSSINSVAGVPNSLAGLGKDFFLNEFGRRLAWACSGWGRVLFRPLFQDYVRAKTAALRCAMQQPGNHTQKNRCVIL